MPRMVCSCCDLAWYAAVASITNVKLYTTRKGARIAARADTRRRNLQPGDGTLTRCLRACWCTRFCSRMRARSGAAWAAVAAVTLGLAVPSAAPDWPCGASEPILDVLDSQVVLSNVDARSCSSRCSDLPALACPCSGDIDSAAGIHVPEPPAATLASQCVPRDRFRDFKGLVRSCDADLEKRLRAEHLTLACLDLQAYLHVQWLRFQHVSSYSLRKTSGNTKD